MTTKILGLVLAGGRSTRIGTDKAMLQFNGVSLVQHTSELLAPLVDEVVISRTAELDYTGFETLPDRLPDKGPLSGVHSAMMAYPDYHLLVVPVDLPLLSAESVSKLIAFASESQSNCAFEKANSDSLSGKQTLFHFPLFIRNTEKNRDILDAIMHSGDSLSVYGFLRQSGYQLISACDDKELTNINYLQQWTQLIQTN